MTVWAFLLLPVLQASAVTVGFDPAAQTVSTGALATVDMFASLTAGEIVSAYDLQLNYDASVVRAIGVTFADSLGNPDNFESITSFDLSTAGVLNLADVSLLSDADLATLQASLHPLSLATITFRAIGGGTSSLSIVNYGVGGNDMKGANDVVLSPTLGTGSINVAASASVPEVPVYLLVGSGLITLMYLYKYRGCATRPRPSV